MFSKINVVPSKINVVPRWLIFAIDLSICLFSFVVAYLVKYNFDLSSLNMKEFSRNVIIMSVINCVVFVLVRAYSGIIRYTSDQDTFRILFAVLISNGAFFFINLIIMTMGKAPYISSSLLLVNALASFLLLITYRVFIKYFFTYIKNFNLDKRRVIIYGAGECGLAVKRTFDHDTRINKNIVAFIDDDERKVGKTIDGVKILNANLLEDLIKEYQVDDVILASYDISPERKNRVVDICLEQEVIVLNTPPTGVWGDGNIVSSQIKRINIEDLLNRKPIEIDTEGIGKQLSGKRILITGAAGSIGSEIVRQLLNFQIGLIILCDQSETALHEIYLEMKETHRNINFHAFVGDVRDEMRMNYLFETLKPHYVYHAAAYKHVPLMEDNPAEAVKTNVLGSKIIADLSVKYGVLKFVMISTDKAVNPANVMGATKRIAEIYVQSLNNLLHHKDYVFSNGFRYINDLNVRPITKFITTRFGNVLGSNGSVIPRFKRQIEKGGPITVTHPEISRYFMTIPEACRLVLEAGCMGVGGEIYIFDMGKSVKIIDLAQKMIRLAGLVPNDDIKIQFTGLRPGEKLFEELLDDHENTMPTHHEKIMIGKVREYVFTDVENQINTILQFAKNNDDRQVVKGMKKLVKEYYSNNSIFEELDFPSKID